MQQAITNKHDIPMALAVWLVNDDYDYQNIPNYISATALMKPLRHMILPRRVPDSLRVAPDVTDMISRAMGHSLHDSIERAWTKNHVRNLQALGIPDNVISLVKVNPEPEELTPESIPVYLEQRATRTVTIGGIDFTIGGKFDLVAQGIVHDNKSTTVFTWIHGGKDDDYKIQGSIYRWLNPDKITEDFIRINFIFTDWQKSMVKSNPNYPQQRCAYKDIPLMSLQETEDWIKAKLTAYLMYREKPEPEVPGCTTAELWMSDPVYKYYADPAKTDGRSTKNFDDAQEAKVFLISKQGKGVLKTVPGVAKRCAYCEAYPICTQQEKAQDV